MAGPRELIQRIVRYRRMFGGAMRQVGIFAAAGLYALDHNIARLAEDHANAKIIAKRLAACRRIVLDPVTVQTNILVFEVTPEAPDAPTIVNRARERGVLVFAFGPRIIRAVTHLDVTREQCERAAAILVELAESAPGSAPPGQTG